MSDTATPGEGEASAAIINSFIHCLYEARQGLRVPRVQLAAELDISKDTLISWEIGRGKPITASFFRWAHRLGYIVDIREDSHEARIEAADSPSGMRSAEYSLLWIARALRKVRIDAGITQEALGAELGVSEWTIGQWESTTRTPRLGHLVRWCQSLDCRLELTKP